MIDFNNKVRKAYRYTYDNGLLIDNNDGEVYDMTALEDCLRIPSDVPSALLNAIASNLWHGSITWNNYLESMGQHDE